MKMPSETAMAVVQRFAWSSNVMRDGKLVSQEYVVAEAIDQALAAERARCADIAHKMGRGLLAKSRTNKMDRAGSHLLAQCRDKILALKGV